MLGRMMTTLWAERVYTMHHVRQMFMNARVSQHVSHFWGVRWSWGKQSRWLLTFIKAAPVKVMTSAMALPRDSGAVSGFPWLSSPDEDTHGCEEMSASVWSYRLDPFFLSVDAWLAATATGPSKAALVMISCVSAPFRHPFFEFNVERKERERD